MGIRVSKSIGYFLTKKKASLVLKKEALKLDFWDNMDGEKFSNNLIKLINDLPEENNDKFACQMSLEFYKHKGQEMSFDVNNFSNKYWWTDANYSNVKNIG
jgi:hypothetical protein